MNRLKEYGWTQQLAAVFARLDDGLEPARVIEEQRGACRVVAESGPQTATLAPKLRLAESGPPVVGDWVALASGPESKASVQHVLERRTRIVRKVAGRTRGEQVLAANLNTVFLVTSHNDDFSPRRIERYLTLVRDGGASPVVLINKSDLSDAPDEFVQVAEALAAGAPVRSVCARTEHGLEALRPYLGSGETVALLGSSGVGKSTMLNRLAGSDIQSVKAVRDSDAKGRHTTTSRQLFLLPCGALLIDTPGLREVGLWQSESGLDQTFPELERLAAACRFTDCAHESEPGCAVLAAIESSDLPAERIESYRQLRSELAFMDRKADLETEANVKRRWKSIHKNVRQARKKG